MEKYAKLSDTVMLIDAAFLNFVVSDVKKNFERMLGRSLKDIDLSELVSYFALDAGVGEGENNIQVLFIYDEESQKLLHCHPSDLAKELNDTAFKNYLGEFAFNSFQPEQLTTLDELYLESLKVIADAKEVKRLLIISFNEEYGEKVHDVLKKTEGKEIVQLRMNEPEYHVDYRWEILAYPIMQALGIRGEELG